MRKDFAARRAGKAEIAMQHTTPNAGGTVEGALDLIRSGDVIATTIYGCEPTTFLSQLHTVAQRAENICLWSVNIMGPYPVMLDNSLKGRIDVLSIFYNASCRAGQASGRFNFVPLDLHRVAPGIIAARRPTVFAAAVSPPDAAGNVSVSLDLEIFWECLETADRVIFEVNPNIPPVDGETKVPLSRASYWYETSAPLPNPPAVTPTEVEKTIAGYVASLIRDGDCIQLGIGGMPNAVGDALADKHDLGVHTEMLTSSMGRLMRRGVVTNARKNYNSGRTVAAFAWGDQALYDLMREAPAAFAMGRPAYVNDPFNIARNDNFVSVNTAIQLDLTGQVCSESIGSRQFSGTGGASDFAYGALHSKGGRGIIALPSTAKGGAVSKIVPRLTPGAVVSISRNLVDHVVTEYGIARLRDRTVRQRIENLIAVAHPDFRGELRREAEKLLL